MAKTHVIYVLHVAQVQHAKCRDTSHPVLSNKV